MSVLPCVTASAAVSSLTPPSTPSRKRKAPPTPETPDSKVSAFAAASPAFESPCSYHTLTGIQAMPNGVKKKFVKSLKGKQMHTFAFPGSAEKMHQAVTKKLRGKLADGSTVTLGPDAAVSRTGDTIDVKEKGKTRKYGVHALKDPTDPTGTRIVKKRLYPIAGPGLVTLSGPAAHAALSQHRQDPGAPLADLILAQHQQSSSSSSASFSSTT